MTTPPDSLRFRRAELTPAERAAAVAALLAADLLRHLRPSVAAPGRRDAGLASTGCWLQNRF